MRRRRTGSRCSGLDPDLWALLLTQEYDGYPNIRALLPACRRPALQGCGTAPAGARLAVAEHGLLPPPAGAVAHVGAPARRGAACSTSAAAGAGSRAFARDVTPGGCTAATRWSAILDACRDGGVPADARASEFVPDRLPFDEPFDLAFAFSVFTHISERGARALPRGPPRRAARRAGLSSHGPAARVPALLRR